MVAGARFELVDGTAPLAVDYGLGDLGGDGVGVAFARGGDVRWIAPGSPRWCLERACERPREERRLGLLDPVAHKLVALHDVVELEVTDAAVADELVR